MIKISFASAI